MADPRFRIEATASFLERLEAIEAFLVEAGAAFAYDRLIDDLRSTVVPNLARFPRIGRLYLDNPPQSAEALAQFASLPAGAADTLREYLHGDYLVLYALSEPDRVIHLLSIRHHRQISFDFARLWPGSGMPSVR